MAIAAIVLSIAVPSFQTSVQNNRKTTAVNDLATALQMARNTAITRRITTTVCKSNDGAACNIIGGDSGDWTQGWIIFTDAAGASGQLDGSDQLLRVHAALTGNATFIGNLPVINRVTFSPQGLSGNNGTITLCDSRGDINASAIVISRGGQVRHATDSDSDNIVDVIDTRVPGGVRNVTCPI